MPFTKSDLSDRVLGGRLRTRFRGQDCAIHTFSHNTGNVSHEQREYWNRVRSIGSGSFGHVYLQQCKTGEGSFKLRAVKQIAKRGDGSASRDFLRELEAMLKFSETEYTQWFVKSYGWYYNDHSWFIAMEYFSCGDLQKYITEGPLGESSARQVAFQVLEGLRFMHKEGFAHRDLKPGNILVKSTPPAGWWVKLGDFGISKKVIGGPSDLSTLQGTRDYMAPELWEIHVPGSKPVPYNAQAADIWALGEISFRMLTAQPTFKSPAILFSYVHSIESFPSPYLEINGVSKDGVEFLEQAMRAAPEGRLSATQALNHRWLNKCVSDATGLVSDISTELIALSDLPTKPLDESISAPSNRWSTVSGGITTPRTSTDRIDRSTKEISGHKLSSHMNGKSSGALISSTKEAVKSTERAIQSRYFILKSRNETNIETSSAHSIWCCSPADNTKLSNAFNSTSGGVFLIFSVNESRKFCGVAQMTSAWNSNVPDYHWEDGHWEGGFLVEWKSWTAIHFDDVQHLTHKENDGWPITRAHFLMEICSTSGLAMMEKFGVANLAMQPRNRPAMAPSIGNPDVHKLASDTHKNAAIGDIFQDAKSSGRSRQRSITNKMPPNTGKRKRPLIMASSNSENKRKRPYRHRTLMEAFSELKRNNHHPPSRTGIQSTHP